MDKNTELTAREKKVVEYMRAWVKKKGYPPTVREICRDLEIKSTSTVHKTIASLEEKGYVKKDPVKRRAIEILNLNETSPDESRITAGTTPDFPGFNKSGLSASSYNESIVEVPVIGRVAAGLPVLAEQNIEDSFPLPARFINGGAHFMLKVRGDSMIEAGILDGDYILVRSQATAHNGEIVVAMVQGQESEATVKTFYKENGHIRLQPENSAMEPIIVPDATVLGLVKGVFRYLQ